MAIDNQEIEQFVGLAEKFSQKTISSMFEGEFSDGNLELLPSIYDSAFDIGFASSPDTSLAGSEYGIWGSKIDSSGLLSSILTLLKISEVCGGVAMGINSQGVATNLMLQAKKELPFATAKVALCFQEGFSLPWCGTILSPNEDLPVRISTSASSTENGYIINGSKSFVYSMGDVDAYVLLARVEDKWGCFVIPSDDDGLTGKDVGQRTGIRACRVNHIEFNDVFVPEDARIDDGDAMSFAIRAMCLNWIGITAIAAGIARGAVSSARTYVADRYQGGGQIEDHSAIKRLVADSEARAYAAESTVLSLKDINLGFAKNLKLCAMAKLAGLEHCAMAVTDCLQSFGGYGYMEDFGMEKRLRDVTTLKSAFGSPNYLRQLIFDLGKEI